MGDVNLKIYLEHGFLCKEISCEHAEPEGLPRVKKTKLSLFNELFLTYCFNAATIFIACF